MKVNIFNCTAKSSKILIFFDCSCSDQTLPVETPTHEAPYPLGEGYFWRIISGMQFWLVFRFKDTDSTSTILAPPETFDLQLWSFNKDETVSVIDSVVFGRNWGCNLSGRTTWAVSSVLKLQSADEETDEALTSIAFIFPTAKAKVIWFESITSLKNSVFYAGFNRILLWFITYLRFCNINKGISSHYQLFFR